MRGKNSSFNAGADRDVTKLTETIRTSSEKEITNPTDDNVYLLANVMSNNYGNNGMT